MFGLNLEKLNEMNQVISPCGSGFRRFQKIKSDIDIRILFGIVVARLRVGICDMPLNVKDQTPQLFKAPQGPRPQKKDRRP